MRTNGNGSRRPHEIQAEIERTRREMDGTLWAIQQRLTPGQIVDQGLSYLRQSGGQEFVSNLGQQAKQNPLPVALVGIGLAWLMATRTNSGTQPELDTGPSLGEQASQAKARLSETASSVRDTAAAIRDRAAGMRDSARQQMDRARGGVDTMMREQPLALGAIGLALGALAAAVTPRTRQEEQLAGKIDEVANPRSEPDAEPRPEASNTEDVTAELRWREEQREQLAEGVKPYAEHAQSEPPEQGH